MAVLHIVSPKALPHDVAGVYFHAARSIMSGHVPYVQVAYEYPPGSIPFLGLAWLIGGRNPFAFVVTWTLVMLAVDALIVHMLLRLRRGTVAALGWVIGVVLVGPTALTRNDLLAVAGVISAAVLLSQRRTLGAGAAIAFGVAAKIWPVAPFIALTIALPRARRRFVTGAALVAAAAFAALAPFGALGAMVRTLFLTQGRRPLEIESSWASVIQAVAVVNGTRLRFVSTFGSANLDGWVLLSRVAGMLTSAAMIGCALAPLVIARRTGRPASAAVLAWLFAAFVDLILLVDPVFSAQYVLWSLGTACLVIGQVHGRRARRHLQLCLIACGATQLIYPIAFVALMHQAWPAVLVLVLRNVVVVAALVTAAQGLRSCVRRDASDHLDRSLPIHAHPA